MRLIDADALRDWFDGQGDVIATTDVQALIDNWPTVSCGGCAYWLNEFGNCGERCGECHAGDVFYPMADWTRFDYGCSNFERREP